MSLVAGYRAAFGPRVAVGAEQRQLAVPRQGDLRAGIAAFVDVRPDQRVEMIERLVRRSRAPTRLDSGSG